MLAETFILRLEARKASRVDELSGAPKPRFVPIAQYSLENRTGRHAGLAGGPNLLQRKS